MIKLIPSLEFLFFFLFCTTRELSEASSPVKGQAQFPPRGWNSYDSFSWTISEEEFLQNAEIVANKLSHHGYQYVVVDYLWYRRKVEGAFTNSLGHDVIDKWGRVIPDPGRWPSSRDGKGFTEVAKKVHALGLKFGIHVMRGISTQAVNANTPILDTSKGVGYVESGRQWYAKDIGLTGQTCKWMSNGFMNVDTKLGAARAFLKSLYLQYAEWGVDFVKHDCIFGDDLNVNEITVVSEVLNELDRPIVYSLSPGTGATPSMAKRVTSLVNMYRVTGDDWDKWDDVAFHFDVSRDFAASNLADARGLKGNSWPDLDMLPMGWLTDPGSNQGPHRESNLNLEEKRTQMTLWSMAKSPLMFGGDLRKLDNTTYDIIANPTLLDINFFSMNNREFPYITGTNDENCKRPGITEKITSPSEMNLFDTHALRLTSCNDHQAKGWVSEVLDNELERICWKDMGGKYTPPFCLHKRKPLFTSDAEMLYEHKSQGKFHLVALNSTEFCLDASPRRKFASQDMKRNSFLPCRSNTNQMWKLNNNETLVNSYSGLCGVIETVKANANSGGIRSWVATGRRGEIYLSFFNLAPQKTVISAKILDLDKALPGTYLGQSSCNYREVWNKKDYGQVSKGAITMAVAGHGCALLVLNCVHKESSLLKTTDNRASNDTMMRLSHSDCTSSSSGHSAFVQGNAVSRAPSLPVYGDGKNSLMWKIRVSAYIWLVTFLC